MAEEPRGYGENYISIEAKCMVKKARKAEKVEEKRIEFEKELQCTKEVIE